MNRTIDEATVKRFYYESPRQLESNINDFIAAYNFGRRLKLRRGLTRYEYIYKIAGTKHLAAKSRPAQDSNQPSLKNSFDRRVK